MYVDDETLIAQCNNGMTKDELITRIVNIANGIEAGIVMEVDKCENYPDHQLPILDMKVWMNEEGYCVYKHFEKPMASKLVISARSAHANQCKRSVHVNEIVRRLQNTSRKLDWDLFCLNIQYMLRMKKAGYNEDYRKHVLLNPSYIQQPPMGSWQRC